MDTSMIDLDSVFNSARDGQWLLFAGALLMAIIQIFRKVLPFINEKIPKRALPWIIFAIGVLAAGGGVLAGGGGWQAAVIAGVTVGVMSLGTYDLVKGGAASFAVEPTPVEPVAPPVDAPPETTETNTTDAAPAAEEEEEKQS